MSHAKMSKVTVLLAEHEFVRFDSYCETRGFKKSTLIARLIREYLNAEQYQQQAALNLSAGNARDAKQL